MKRELRQQRRASGSRMETTTVITRRDALARGAGVLASALVTGGVAACRRPIGPGGKASAATTTDPLSGDHLYRDVVQYYDLGPHRTATAGDLRTSDWIATRLEQAGLATEKQPWRLKQVFLDRASLTVAGDEIDCFPAWLPRLTGSEGVRAPLVSLDGTSDATRARGRVALIVSAASVSDAENQALTERAIAAGAAGIVAVVPSPSGGIMALNAHAPNNQNAPPVAIVLAAPKDQEKLQRAAAAGSQVSMIVDGRLEPDAEAKNVVGRLDRGRGLIVVSTPQSGWFNCAGERGPGIALFLGLAEWATKAGSTASWLFVSTSGHELGYMGMEHFMDTAAPHPEEVVCWVALGASIATRAWRLTDDGPQPLPGPPETGDLTEKLVSSDDLLPVLERTFAGVPGITPRAGAALGELKNVLEAGYSGFGFFGGHYYFHSPLDTPKTTSPELLAPVGRAVAATIEDIEARSASQPARG